MKKSNRIEFLDDQPMPDPMPEPDEYHGQGGAYVIDPATGKRILIERTQPADKPGEQ